MSYTVLHIVGRGYQVARIVPEVSAPFMPHRSTRLIGVGPVFSSAEKAQAGLECIKANQGKGLRLVSAK